MRTSVRYFAGLACLSLLTRSYSLTSQAIRSERPLAGLRLVDPSVAYRFCNLNSQQRFSHLLISLLIQDEAC